MAQFFIVDGVDLGTDAVRLGSEAGFISVAEQGTISTSMIRVDDPAGTRDLVGWQPLIVNESLCSHPTLFRGFLAARSISRGEDDSLITGAARVWDADVVDLNAKLYLRAIHLREGKRPRETDLARRDWIVNSQWFPSDVEVGTYVSDDEPATLDEADYRGQYAADVLNDCVNARFGKNYFLHWDETLGASLFYGPTAATTLTSSLRISNVEADRDDVTTFAPWKDAVLRRDPDKVYSGVYLQYNNGSILRVDSSTIAAFLRRDITIRNDRISRLSTAESIVSQYLAKYSAEEDRITCTVRLPAASVNLVREGMRIECKFSHLPGYSSFTFLRVVRIEKRQTFESDAVYDVKLEMVPTNRASSGGGPGTPPGGGGGSGPGPFVPPSVDSCGDLVVQTSTTFTFGTPTTPGNTVLAFCANRNGATPSAPWVEVASAEINITGTSHAKYVWIYKYDVSIAETVYTQPAGSVGAIVEWQGSIDVLDTAIVESVPADGHTEFGGPVTTTGPAVVFGVAGYVTFDADPMDDAIADDGTVFVNQQGIAGQSPRTVGLYELSSGGTVNLGAAAGAPGESGGFPGDPHHSAITIALRCTVEDLGAPGPGQEVCEQFTGDGVTDQFTLNNGYLENSLKVTLQGVTPISIDEDDPSAGIFSTNLLVSSGRVFQARYQASAGPATGSNNPVCSTFTQIPPEVLGQGAVGSNVVLHPGFWGPVTEADTRGIFRTTYDGGKEWVQTITATGSNSVIDISAANVFDVTMDANADISLSGATASQFGHAVACDIVVMLRTNGFTPTFTDNIVWTGGTEPTWPTDPDEAVLLGFLTIDGGTTWIGGTRASGSGSSPPDDTQVWMPLTTVVSGVPDLVWDTDGTNYSLVPTLVPLSGDSP